MGLEDQEEQGKSKPPRLCLQKLKQHLEHLVNASTAIGSKCSRDYQPQCRVSKCKIESWNETSECGRKWCRSECRKKLVVFVQPALLFAGLLNGGLICVAASLVNQVSE